jgi:integrase
MKQVLPLTDVKLRNLQPKPKIYKVFDGNGLYIEVTPQGTKTWRLKYRLNKQDKRQTFGRWPDISLKKARELTSNFKANLLNDTLLPKKADIITVKKLCSLFLEQNINTHSHKLYTKKLYFINKYINPTVGNFDANTLTPANILNLVLKPIQDKNLLETTHRVKSLISQIFQLGFAHDLVHRNPTLELHRALIPIVPKHYPTIIDPQKIGYLLSDIRNYTGSPIVSYALKILPYIFVRPGELRHAEWSEINFEEQTWRIPDHKMKMRTPHIVPLSNQVISWLKELHTITGSGKYLFPGRNLKTKPLSDMAINAALRYLGYDNKEIVGHGFRAMASTLLNEKGYHPDWIERQLAHSERNSVRAAYNHAEYLPERRKMMQDWADYLDNLIIKASFRPPSRP